MESSTISEKSFSSLFNSAFELLNEIRNSSLNSTDASYQSKVKQCMAEFLRCYQGDLFSSNEGIEEFSAQRLRFILVPAYLAELVQLVVDDNRGRNLVMSKKWIKDFLEICERLELVDEKDLKTLARERRPADQVRREEKIDRAKREMQNKKKLRALQQKLEENEKKNVDDDAGIDEEVFRECVELEIQVEITRAIESLDLIDQELPLVQRMEDMKKLEKAKGDRWKEKKDEPQKTNPITVDLPLGYSKKVGPNGQVTISKDPVFEGLDSRRTEFQNNVFRPGYNMATMSIEEAADIDMREAIERQNRENQAKQMQAEAGEDEEDNTIHYDNVQVYKDREWDAFKDDNPTGSGNTTGNLG